MKTSKEITFIALMTAILAVMTLTPLGMIQLPLLSINLVLIPILVCAQLKDLKTAVIISTIFGCLSFVNAFIRPTLLYSMVQNPLVSIVPRMFIGLFANLTYNGIYNWMKWRKNSVNVVDSETSINYGNGFGARYKKEFLPSTISALVGVIVNTTLFLGAIYLIYNGKTVESIGTSIDFEFIMGIVGVNTVIEIIVSMVVVPIILSGLKRALTI